MGIRTIVVVGLAAWAGWLLVRGILNRRVPWIGLALIAVPLLLLGWSERQWISAEHTYSAIARALAPGTEGVHCQRLGETFTYAGAELGHVDWDEDGRPLGAALISYETCGRLAAYADGDKDTPPLEQVIAVHVLTHESMHLAGRLVESDADCAAMQRDAWTAQQLGATAAQGQRLAQTYWREVYPRMPDAYTDRACAAGEALDESPGDGVWP
ncbi:MAG: PrgI family protein [Candidatus Nanopelagicales bacterium]